MNAQTLIKTLGLQPHPEGGFYRETYRSQQLVKTFDGKKRNSGTAIYFLLQDDNFSAFHRIRSDELWFFHCGEPLEVISIIDGKLKVAILGNDIANGQLPQLAIPANTWFASRISSGSGFSLVSCTVSPGFDFFDFELANRSELIAQFPQLSDIINHLTRE